MTDFASGFRAGVEAAADEIEATRQGAATLPKYLIVERVRALQPPQQPDAPERVCIKCKRVYEPGMYPRGGQCDDCFFEQQPDAAPSCPTCSGSGEIWNGVTLPEPCDDPRHFEFTRPLAPASPALAAWSALSDEERCLAMGAIEQEARESWLQLNSKAMSVAVDLLRSLAPEAGDADGGKEPHAPR